MPLANGPTINALLSRYPRSRQLMNANGSQYSPNFSIFETSSSALHLILPQTDLCLIFHPEEVVDVSSSPHRRLYAH